MKKVVIFATAIALLATSLAVAQPERMGRMAGRLNLSDQQIDQLERLQIQYEKDMVKPQCDLKMERLNLRELLMQQNIDEKAVMSAGDSISMIKADIARIKLQHMLAARKVLTPDQLKQWMRMHRELVPRNGARGAGYYMGPRMRGPGGMNTWQSPETEQKKSGK
jgi:Spy/CpxP family protein refolding chaperone